GKIAGDLGADDTRGVGVRPRAPHLDDAVVFDGDGQATGVGTIQRTDARVYRAHSDLLCMDSVARHLTARTCASQHAPATVTGDRVGWVGPAGHNTAMFKDMVRSESELRDLFGYPSERAILKEQAVLDEHSRAFIARSPFLLLATSDSSGRCDVSPKGDAPG